MITNNKLHFYTSMHILHFRVLPVSGQHPIAGRVCRHNDASQSTHHPISTDTMRPQSAHLFQTTPDTSFFRHDTIYKKYK